MNDLFHTFYDSPLGQLKLVANKNALISLQFQPKESETILFENEILIQTKNELDLYFDGKLNLFSIPILLNGTTFQQKVWRELQNIPFGETISYLTLSKNIDNQKAIRAAGTANGKNPIPIIVPCHRVIGSNGNLIGFSGGIENKRWLLNHESSLCGKTLF